MGSDQSMYEVPGFRLREMSDDIASKAATINAVYDWLARDLAYGVDMTTPSKPDWLNVRQLATAYMRYDQERGRLDPDETLEDYVAMLCGSASWPLPE